MGEVLEISEYFPIWSLCHEPYYITTYRIFFDLLVDHWTFLCCSLQYYIASNGKGIVDDVNKKLREGCPSYYNESDYHFYSAIEALKRAASTSNVEERDGLAKDALDLLSRVPETANLLSVCQHFEDIQYSSLCNVLCNHWNLVTMCENWSCVHSNYGSPSAPTFCFISGDPFV